jgi:hypothetical protein
MLLRAERSNPDIEAVVSLHRGGSALAFDVATRGLSNWRHGSSRASSWATNLPKSPILIASANVMLQDENDRRLELRRQGVQLQLEKNGILNYELELRELRNYELR